MCARARARAHMLHIYKFMCAPQQLHACAHATPSMRACNPMRVRMERGLALIRRSDRVCMLACVRTQQCINAYEHVHDLRRAIRRRFCV